MWARPGVNAILGRPDQDGAAPVLLQAEQKYFPAVDLRGLSLGLMGWVRHNFAREARVSAAAHSEDGPGCALQQIATIRLQKFAGHPG
jgi:hypothetical protein